MTLAQWISIAIIALLPATWVFASHLARLPEEQRKYLPIYAQMAVQEIEQTQGNADERSKKELAMASCVKHFRGGHLPIPGHDRIEAAIDSALYQLKAK